MRAGNLNTRAILQRLTGSDDGQGAQESARFVTVDTVWIGLRLLRGQELMQHQQRQGQILYEITMRYRTDVRSSMRLVVGPRIYQLVSPPADPDNRHQYMLMDAEIVEDE